MKRDICNFDWYIFKQIHNGLKAYRKAYKYSHPLDFESVEDWNNYLDKMIELIGEGNKIDDWNNYDDKKFKKGMKMFFDYFWDLWI